MKLALDEYSRNARLKPALLTMLPAAVTLAALSPDTALVWGGIWGTVVALGGTYFIAQVGRDWGKQKEPSLFDRFGGRPTERLLSHTHTPNKVRLSAHHARLRELLPTINIPTADDERRDPSGAHQVYAACTQHLISRSRDDRLLLQENISYGFRRNLWGLKPLGVVVSLAALASIGVAIYMDGVISPRRLLVGAVDAAALLAWVAVITPSWVMIPARAYAERLMETLDR